MFRSLLTLLVLLQALEVHSTPLDDYVAKPDPSYKWWVHSTKDCGDHRCHVLVLHSQTWRTEDEVDRPLWEHWLTIVEPKEAKSDTALLFIGSGDNGAEPPKSVRPPLDRVAVKTGAVVAELHMVPNQRIRFLDEQDPRYQKVGRKEDELVAYTWNRYFEEGDPTWIAQLPMTKAVVRAMDAVQEFTKSELNNAALAERFVLAGASKRGWTCWTTAAVDRRVCGVAALVIDLLNLKQSLDHHYGAYGQWSVALHDYEELGIPQRWREESLDTLLAVIEPFTYRDRLTMPKLILNSSGDEFFLPDSSRFYFSDLLGPKILRYVPNTDHSLRESDAMVTVAGFFESLINGQRLPYYDWSIDEKGCLALSSSEQPTKVTLWSAHNPTARDFRLSTIGRNWKGQELRPSDDGAFKVNLQKPAEGWSAYMIELTFAAREHFPLTVTSDIFVLPETMPYCAFSR